VIVEGQANKVEKVFTEMGKTLKLDDTTGMTAGRAYAFVFNLNCEYIGVGLGLKHPLLFGRIRSTWSSSPQRHLVFTVVIDQTKNN
jgi:hypothetical protein